MAWRVEGEKVVVDLFTEFDRDAEDCWWHVDDVLTCRYVNVRVFCYVGGTWKRRE